MSLALLISAGALLAQQSADIPPHNWTVPPYQPGRASGGITTMTDITPGVAFVGIQPCRVVDTRPSQGFAAAWGPPILAANAIRAFDINSAPHCPGIPAGVDAYSLNFTVTENTGPGDIRSWPTGNPPPTATSVLNWNAANTTIANATIIPAGTNGNIDVQVAGNATHLIIDINGYFSDTLGSGNSFLVSNNSSYSIAGLNANTGLGAVAVFGSVGAGNPCVACLSFGGGVVGVAGSSDQSGVTGLSSTGFAVDGFTTGGSGGLPVAEGALGVHFSQVPFNYGVYAYGDYGGTGAKYFVEPHPSDPAKVIRYIALEGPEPGTYFRGRGRFERGMARIPVPDDFRMVTDQEGLTVQITPIGAMASVAVLKADLNEIAVQSSRNVEFYYLVQGIRRTHKHLTSPIAEGAEYMPRSAESTMPLYLTEGQKRLLVQNGTYREDGAVNMETAHRLGWDRKWAERAGSPAPQPNP